MLEKESNIKVVENYWIVLHEVIKTLAKGWCRYVLDAG